ncbi:ABC transporter permease [Luteococcus peritonei]|uniref:FtsX-like permease family protein n=1 Tax=Luteococcus peritonei TaxID=88874 RepID=A0ABW4RVD5_9ACTN
MNPAVMRLARREISRNPMRSLLICLLVALPMVLFGAMAVTFASSTSTEQETQQATFGRASAVVQAPSGGRLPALSLEQGQRAVPFGQRTAELVDHATKRSIEVQDIDLHDPVFEGRFSLEERRQEPNGVWLDSSLARPGTVGLAQTVTIDGRSWPVLGVVTLRMEALDGVYVAHGHPLAAKASTGAWIQGPEPSQQQQEQWESQGLQVGLPMAGNWAGVDQATVTALLFSFALAAGVVTAALCAAAFTVGLARQRRSLSVLGAVGAPSGQLRAIALAQGLLLGVPSALVGVLLGTGLGAWWVSQHLGTEFSSYYGVHIPWLRLLGLVLVGVLSALVGAWLPARRLGEVTQDQARPVSASVPRRSSRLRVGLLLIALGLGCAILLALVLPRQRELPEEEYVISGILCCLLVFLGILLSAGALARRLGVMDGGPMPWRLAVRELGRQRSRAVSVIVAMTAVSALASGALVALAAQGGDVTPAERLGWAVTRTTDENGKALPSSDAKALDEAISSTVGISSGIDAAMTGHEVGANYQCARRTVCSVGTGLLVVTPEQAQQVLGNRAEPDAMATLTAGGVILGQGQGWDGSEDEFVLDPGASDGNSRAVTLHATVAPALGPGWAMVTRQTVERHHLGPLLPVRVMKLGAVPSQEQVDQIGTVALEHGLPAPLVEAPGEDFVPRLLRYVSGAGLLLCLAVGAITTGLGVKDARENNRTMVGVGAKGSTIRGVGAALAGLGNGLGVVLGVVAGALPMALVTSAMPYPLGLPWLHLLALLVLVPLLCSALGWLLARPPAPRAVRID